MGALHVPPLTGRSLKGRGHSRTGHHRLVHENIDEERLFEGLYDDYDNRRHFEDFEQQIIAGLPLNMQVKRRCESGPSGSLNHRTPLYGERPHSALTYFSSK